MTVEIRVLDPADDRGSFRSGDPALDLFFQRYAGQNQFRHHIGVSYVALQDRRLVGFVTIAPGALDAEVLPSGRRLPPYPVPILRVARLAVAESVRGQGLGRALLRFTIELAERMAAELGCVGVVVDAKPGAEGFYRRHGFLDLATVAGSAAQRPQSLAMFLSLGSVPRKP